ncbi:DUF3054 domain-containing protein [Miltoncostaea oceani]|uniref:DUF3054 domain-containing protein n=1 Tax=Miltoncostaea oceani TaxID=2843216 RepID=UPI001C3C59F4|nr:DUF3054 domain-containing protein [Miltoncostaea oceani]
MIVRPRAIAAAVLADAAGIVLFAALGRASHDEGSAVAGTLEVAAPFLIGAAAGWAVARGGRAPVALTTGVAAWAGALTAGMALRGLVFDRGTAPSFVVVAAIVLGVLLLGWRLAVRVVERRRGAARV